MGAARRAGVGRRQRRSAVTIASASEMLAAAENERVGQPQPPLSSGIQSCGLMVTGVSRRFAASRPARHAQLARLRWTIERDTH